MKEGKAYKYAVWCSTEQEGKVPEYVKKQAESWLHIADGNDEDAYVDEQEYEKICKLLKLMVHPDLRCSIYDGLEDYAWFMIVAGLCTYCRNSEQRSRFYVTILLEIARKNFKTFNSAVIFILLMLTEPDFSRFFSVAPDLQLSSELKNAIRKIIKVSPALYDEDEPAFKVLRSQIIYIYARVMGFIPKEKINIKTQKEHVDYQRMISKGECIACGEEVIDYSVVENYVIHLLEEEYGVIVEQVGYDRYNAISSVQKMEAEGLECVEIKQHSSVLHQPTKWLKELILQQAFRYEENRLLEINFQNARCTEDTNLNKYVNKKKSTGKVDEVVALINAMYLLQQYLLNGDNFVAQTA